MAQGLQQGDHVDGVAVAVVEILVRADFSRRRRTRLMALQLRQWLRLRLRLRVEILVDESEPTAAQPVIRAAVFIAFVDHVHLLAPRFALPRPAHLLESQLPSRNHGGNFRNSIDFTREIQSPRGITLTALI